MPKARSQQAAEGTVRVVEGVDAVVGGQVVVAEKLRAAVEGDGPARGRGQARERVANRANDAAGTSVAVWDEADEPALVLDNRWQSHRSVPRSGRRSSDRRERGQVGLAVGAAKDQQIGFPVPELPALADLGGSLRDHPCLQDLRAARLVAIEATPRSDRWRPTRLAGRRAAPAQPLGTEQVAMQRQRATLGTVDELVDRLVGQARAVAGKLQAASDLLGRPLIAARSIRFRRDAGAHAGEAKAPAVR